MNEILRQSPALDNLDPFGLPAPADWPPTDPEELAALDRWMDRQERLAISRRERESIERIGNDFDHDEA